MAEFKVESKNKVEIEKKPRVYFTCHPQDFDHYFKKSVRIFSLPMTVPSTTHPIWKKPLRKQICHLIWDGATCWWFRSPMGC